MGDIDTDTDVKAEWIEILDKLSEYCAKTGESAVEVLTNEVQNSSRVAACRQHAFWMVEPPSVGVGRESSRFHCANCGGWLRFPEAAAYRAGYEAHGGSADDLFVDVSIN